MSLQQQLPCSSAAAAIPISAIPAVPVATTGMRGEGKKGTSRGRQRIEIAPIKDKPKRHVTFKKRRDGLFKKASELCVLCGANVAILAFSGAGKMFCFGFPSVDAVVSDFLQGRPSSSSFTMIL